MLAHILVVEDNLTNLQLMLYVLGAFGYETTAATDGLSGLEALETSTFDLILCDVLMPGIDGLEFARRYKSDARNTAPLVAVTALAMVGDKERLLAAGFDGYIPKPIEPETFIEAIKSYLSDVPSGQVQPAGAEGTASPEEAKDLGPTILTIDDTQVNIDLVRAWLQPFGYRVVAARSVREGLEKASSRKPALILCDLHMLGGDGFEMLRKVKTSPELSDVPFFMLSSTSWGSSDRVRGMQLGARKFLVRPIDPHVLRSEIEAALAEP